MNSMVSQNFILRKSKKSDKENGIIYLRIIVKGIRAELSMKRYCEYSKWNPSTGRSNGRCEEAKILNRYLDDMEHSVYEAHRQLIFEKQEINIETLKNKIFGIKSSSRMLCNVFEKHNADFKDLVGKEYTYETYKHFKTALKKIKTFVS